MSTEPPSPARPTESSLTLDRGLALLQAIAEAADVSSEPPAISDLAVRIGCSRAAVYRLLGPLTDRGLVRREGARVRLGLGLLELAGRVLPQVRGVALPMLRELADAVGATAHLSVADGAEMQAVAVVEPSRTTFHVAYRVGSRHPVTAGAAGRAVALTEGWAMTTGELQPGAHGIAAPLLGVPGLRASVGVVAMQPLDDRDVGPQVLAVAEAVALALR